MFDPISLATGAAILVVGYTAGRAHRRGPKPPPPVTATCECRHSLALHDPQVGECHGKVHQSSTGSQMSRWVGCTCRRYVGPKPIESLFALPVLPRED